MRSLATAADKPSHVSVYLTAKRGDAPLSGLRAEDFSLYEQGQLLAPSDVQQTLLGRDVAAVHRTLLLIDVSAATTEDARRELGEAGALFVQTARKSQAVSVFTFDGGPTIRLLREVDWSSGPSEASRNANAELAPQPRDPSRNLNGAIVQALGELDARLSRSPLPLRVGTLVVFAGGPDLAGRVASRDLSEKLSQSTASVLGIGIGDAGAELRGIARDGYVDAHSRDTLSLAFEDAAHRVEADTSSYYLLSYCSPARAERRTLRVEVRAKDAQGKPETASFDTEFDAKGFSAGCDAKATPRFARSSGTR
ncbi:MAG: hypothetical protein QM756_32265 [Polyangiaceae bacterium]